MSYEEERIAKLTFDNADFEKKVRKTIESLNDLEEALDLETSDKTFTTMIKGCEDLNDSMEEVEDTVVSIQNEFTALQVIGITVLSEITKASLKFGKQIYDNTLGQILTGGATRAANIEQAKFMIEGLGFAWSDVSDAINYGVQDTAYGLDEAAKVASQLLASNVPLVDSYGQSVDSMYVALRGISGVAAMANRSYEEVGHVFTSIAAQGRVMGDQMLSLSRYGLSATKALADYLHVAESDISGMVSKGLISFDQFSRAMDEAFGEHAKEANKTLTGALSNMKAALSRIGADFISPFDDFKRDLYNDLRDIIKVVQKTLQPAVNDFKMFLGIAGDWTHELLTNSAFVKAISVFVYDIYSWVRTIIEALYEMGYTLPNVQTLGDLLYSIAINIQLYGDKARFVINIIKDVISFIEILITVIKNVIKILMPVISRVIIGLGRVLGITGYMTGHLFEIRGALIPLIDKIGDLLAMNLDKALNNVAKILPIIAAALGLVYKAVTLVVGGFIMLFSYVGNGIKTFVLNPISTLQNGIYSVGSAALWLADTVTKSFKNLGANTTSVFSNMSSATSALSSGNPIQSIYSSYSSEPIVKANKEIIESNNEVVETWEDATESWEKYDEETGKHAQNIGKYSRNLEANADAVGRAADIYNSSIDDLVDGLTESKRNLGDETERFVDEMDESTDTVESVIRRNTKSVEQTADETVTATTVNIRETLTRNLALFTTALTDLIFNNEIVLSVKEGLTKAVDNILDIANTALELLKRGLTILKHQLGNPWEILGDILLAGAAGLTIGLTSVVTSIGGLLMSIPAAFGSLFALATGFSAGKFAEMFGELSKVLLAFAGLVVVIGIVSEMVDPDSFKTVTDALANLMGLVVAAMQMYAIATTISSVFTAFNIVLQKLLHVTTFSTANTLTAISKVIMSLVAMIFAVVTGIALINMIPEDEFWKGLRKIGVITAGLTAFIVLLSLFGKNLSDVDRLVVKNKTLTKTYSSNVRGIAVLLFELIPIIAGLGLVIKMLGKIDDEVFIKGGIRFGVLLAVITTFVLKITKSLRYFSSMGTIVGKGDILSQDYYDNISALTAIADIIRHLGITVLELTAAIYILGKIPVDVLIQGGIALGSILGSLFVLYLAITGLNQLVSKNKDFPSIANTSIVLTDMQGLIATITLGVLGIVAAFKLMETIDSKRLRSLTGTFTTIMLWLGGLVSYLYLLNFISNYASENHLVNSSSFEKTLGNISDILYGLSAYILSIAGALYIMDKIDDIGSLQRNIVYLGLFISGTALMLALVAKLSGLASTYKSSSIIPPINGLAALFAGFGVALAGVAAVFASMQNLTEEQFAWGLSVAIGAVVIFIAILAVFAIKLKDFSVVQKVVAKEAKKGAATSAATWKEIIAAKAGVLLVAAGMYLLSQAITNIISTVTNVNWNAENIIATIATIVIMIASIYAAMGAISIFTKGKVGYAKAIAEASIMFLMLGGMMLAMSYSFDILGKVDWTNASNGYNAMLIAVISIMGVMALLLEGTRSMTSAKLTSISGIILSISLLTVAIGAMFLEMGNVDWSHGTEIIIAVVGTIGMLSILTAAMALLSAKADTAVIAVGIIAALSAFVLALGGMYFALSKIDWSHTNEMIGVIIVSVGLLGVMLLVCAALSPIAVEASMVIVVLAVFVAALAGLAASIGYSCKMLADASMVFAEAFVLLGKGLTAFIKIDWKSAVKLIPSMLLFFASLSLGMQMLFYILPELLIAANTLPSIAESINSLISLNTTDLENTGDTLAEFFEGLSDGIRHIDLSELMAIAFGLGAFTLAIVNNAPGLAIASWILAAAVPNFASAMEKLHEAAENLNDTDMLSVLGNIILLNALAIPLMDAAPRLWIASGILIFALDFLNDAINSLYEINSIFNKIDMGQLNINALSLVGFSLLIGMSSNGIIISAAALNLGFSILVAASSLLYDISAMWYNADLKGLAESALYLNAFAILLNTASIPLITGSIGLGVAGAALLVSSAIFLSAAAVLNIGMDQLATGITSACDSVVYAINTTLYALEGMDGIATEFEEIGKNVAEGLEIGIEDGTPRAIDAMNYMVDALTAIPIVKWGIHSPSEWMASIGINLDEGLANGIDAGFAVVGNAAYNLVESINNIFSNNLNIGEIIANKLGEAAGVVTGDNGVTLTNAFGALGKVEGYTQGSEYVSAYNGIAGSYLDIQLDALNQKASSIKSQFQMYYSDAEMTKQLQNELKATQAQIDAINEQKKAMDELFEGFDLDDLGGGGGSITVPTTSGTTTGSDALSSISSGGATSSPMSGVDVDNVASNVGSTITTNNTYNFTQNNYSPEPIDRTELYTQTNNQLNTWYSWLRDN